MSWRRPPRCCCSAARRKATKKSSNMLVGNILLVTPRGGLEMFRTFCRRSAFSISFCGEIFCSFPLIAMRAYEKGLRVRWWDFFFYASLRAGRDHLRPHRRRAACIQLSDRAGGLRNQSGARISRRLLIGWIIALIGGIAGLFLSFWWDLPSGAAIVCTFGAILILISFVRVVATLSSSFRRNAGFTITLWDAPQFRQAAWFLRNTRLRFLTRNFPDRDSFI